MFWGKCRYVIYDIYIHGFFGWCLSFPWSFRPIFSNLTQLDAFSWQSVFRWDVQRPDVHFRFHHKQAGALFQEDVQRFPREMLSNSQVGLGDPNTSGERCFYGRCWGGPVISSKRGGPGSLGLNYQFNFTYLQLVCIVLNVFLCTSPVCQCFVTKCLGH